MIGIELIRKDPERVRRAIEARGDSAPVDRVLELDEQRRRTVSEVDDLRAARNQGSARLAKMKERPPEAIDEMRALGSRIKTLESGLRRLEEELNELLLDLPNIPEDGVPVGRDESENVVVRAGGEQPELDFEPLPHWELGERLGIIDFRARRQGLRVAVLRAQGQGGAAPAGPDRVDAGPARVRPRLRGALPAQHRHPARRSLGSGQLPKFYDNMYHDDEDDLWLIPTAEVPITRSLRRGDTVGRRSADEVRGPHPVLPPREGGGRQRHARDQARAPVREGGDVQDRRAGTALPPSWRACWPTPRTSAGAWASPTA